MMKRVSFKTLGCRLNQYETDALVTNFDRAGYRIVDFSEPADVVVINTCTVTRQSDQKSRNLINHSVSKNKDAVIVVTGCMVDNYKKKPGALGPATYAVDNQHKNLIVSLIDSHFKGEIMDPDTVPGDVFGFETVDRSLHTRTSIKIQDGCDNFCTYCIIPSVRGRAVSRPAREILDNVRSVLDNGFRELVLTGVNIGRYNHEGIDFEGIIEQILKIPGEFRLRISSMEPDGFGPGFHNLFLNPKLTPHLHLCLQSGSDRILTKMRRMYTVGSFTRIVERFRKQMPHFNFTTDIIVGFPGETDADFMATRKIIDELKFGHIHTFRYSRRAGTRADRFPDQIPEDIKVSRSEIIRTLSEKYRKAYMQSLVGKQQTVLVEKIDPAGFAHGYGEHYVPVMFRPEAPEKNRFETVTLTRLTGEKDKAVLMG
ncbi:MAG: tRNA (N(6)-L-threonylcarbamoyladenosine(37)-C(2))-methylthiotransferase MtaB [Bacteroidales bacterium]|nr:tRNA (N(6)-L-threonylcarbamoyladenosine(37)-C(2))-methylthiotransferase MtaB [Bacteroidales bacterium]